MGCRVLIAASICSLWSTWSWSLAITWSCCYLTGSGSSLALSELALSRKWGHGRANLSYANFTPLSELSGLPLVWTWKSASCFPVGSGSAGELPAENLQSFWLFGFNAPKMKSGRSGSHRVVCPFLAGFLPLAFDRTFELNLFRLVAPASGC